MRYTTFKDIEMQNFRCHEYMTFNFIPNRFCLITGPNGRGKTSILDALCWCIYDETTKGRKGDDIIRKRTGKDTFVKLNFSIDSDEYQIHNYRKHKEFGDSKILYKNNNDISGATRSETNKKIEALLRSKDIFLNCLLFSQYIGQSFTEMTDTGQKNIFDKMMGLTEYGTYETNAKNNIKTINAELEKTEQQLILLQSFIQQSEDAFQSEKEYMKRCVETFNISKELTEKTIETIKTEIEGLKTEINNHSNYSESLAHLQLSLSEVEKKLVLIKEKINSKLDSIKSNITLEKEKELNKLQSDNDDRLNNLKMNLSKLESKFNVFKQQLTTRKEELKTEYLNRKNLLETPVKENLNKISINYNSIESKINETQKLLAISKKEGDKLKSKINMISSKLDIPLPICYACDQPIKDKSLEKIKGDLSNYQNDLAQEQNKQHGFCAILDNCVKEKKSINETKISLEQKLKEIAHQIDTWKEEELNKLKQIFTEHQKTYDDMNKKINSEISDINSFISREKLNITNKYDSISVDQRNNVLNENTSQIRTLESEKFETKSQIDLINKDIEKLDRLKHDLTYKESMLNSKRNEVKNSFIEYKNRIKEYDTKLFNMQVNISNKQSEEDGLIIKIKALKRNIEILEFWKTAFSSKGIKAILLDEAIPILNEKAIELSSQTQCLRVRFDSQKMLKSKEYRNCFTVMPIQTQNLTDSREDFSAGEGRMIDLITLLSLRHLLERIHDIKYNVALFDEILDALYQDNVEVVVDFLRHLSKESCTLLITHTLRNNIEPDEHLEF